MNRLLLVRHAEAIPGDLDATLTDLGRRQAEALARRLKEWSFDVAWSSDLLRAKETGDMILQGRDTPRLQLAAALREVEIPLEVRDAGVQSDQYIDWEKDTVRDVAQSLSKWLREAKQSQNKRKCTMLVVSHGGPLRVLLCLLLGLPPEMHWSFRLDHASITIVERADDIGTITLLNDRCHLREVTGRDKPRDR